MEGEVQETAILIGLVTPQQGERKTQEYLDELEFLAETAGAHTIKRFTQRMNGPSSTTYLGIGKLQEIRSFIQAEEDAEREVSIAIFDDELSAKQLRNIESELRIKVLDRTSLILDIFAMRAQPMPRLRWSWHNTDTCCPDCNECGHTSRDKEAEADREEVRAQWD